MSAMDTAKEIVRIGATAGLSKDVIDLQEKKLALLAEQLATLERENADLKAENANLRRQLQHAQPVGFVESEGLLWKRTASGGFESRPYCPVCEKHPVMSEFPPGEKFMWCCPANHTFDYDSRPPQT